MGLPERQYETDTRTGQTTERYPTFFGYSAWCIETGIKNDDPETMQACVEAGYLNTKVEALGCSLVNLAKQKKAAKVLAWLKKNGFQ